MNNKGLTLVEMLIVVFFLALITVIIVPNITGLLQKSSENEYQSFLSSLYLATEAYIQANNDIEFVDNSGCVKIIDLVRAKYLKSTTYNPNTKQTILSELNDYVKITINSDNTYEYKYLENCP